jgi:hypothetical protein
MKAAVSATPRPASPLPAAAIATPARMSAFPSGRRRIVRSATATTASVPRLLPSTAIRRAGTKSRWSCACGMESPVTGDVSGTAIATPAASPA